MATKKFKETTPEERIAKNLRAIHLDLKEITGYETYSQPFRNFIKTEYERVQWRNPQLLK